MSILQTSLISEDFQKLGGKGFQLKKLKDLGFNIPNFIIISTDVFSEIIKEASSTKEAIEFIEKYEFENDFLSKIGHAFPNQKYFAVRSSASIEDGKQQSFAGQFNTFLFIRPEDIIEKIKEVWKSCYSQHVNDYLDHNQIQQSFSMAIVIQEMIDPSTSGVAFSMNPINGNRNEHVINAVWGVGEGLVSGQLNSDTFWVSEDEIKLEIQEKSHQFIFNSLEDSGILKVEVSIDKRNQPTLTSAQLNEISEQLKKLSRIFEEYVDIEFCYSSNIFYLLQCRPITNSKQVLDQTQPYAVWDNSNIIESYPGVTTPLTFSFISKSYEGAYKLFCSFLGVDKKTINQHHEVFRNTLGIFNGRVYYNLKSWYEMLALLPGYSLNATFMESMMGVKEKFELSNYQPLSKSKAIKSLISVGIKMTYRYFQLPKERRKFQRLLNETIRNYKELAYSRMSSHELMKTYLDFEHSLLNQWKAPLLNDLFAMIWFGIFQKKIQQINNSNNQNLHNDLLCGNSDIISTQPIYRSFEIVDMIYNSEDSKALFLNHSKDYIWQKLSTDENFILIKNKIDEYIDDFGERCLGELKLETISYVQDPTLFIEILQNYVHENISTKNISKNIEKHIREEAERNLESFMPKNPIKKWWINYALKKTRELVSARENLRYERTRAFGIVRTIFTQIGIKFKTEGIITDSRDIFLLNKEEIFDFISGRSYDGECKQKVKYRKQLMNEYLSKEPISERFETYGIPYHINDFFSKKKIEINEGDLKGIGCCPGIVKARARIVNHPREIKNMNGDILITSSTDPGWITLFPSASGIIVERGSLLSHSAIVSREMGIPCIVSVQGLLKTVKTGDLIEMDGSSGLIKIIKT